ncbi:capsule assembly Wzi family protein [Glacieibacterium sp.]|uniref:capsule assembly Wzi family protein n=1 Tax=Glacieibacterium sp. TaxID=2860237 RepID=UPI003B007400
MKLKTLCASLLLIGAGAGASPWAEVGDRQLRQDVEMLKAAGVIRGPINSWPLPWAQIDNGIAAFGDRPLPPHLAAALRRVEALSDLAQQRTVYEIRANATNDTQLVRDFGGGAREKADVSVRASHDLGSVYVSYGIGYRNGERGKDFNFEPSYIAVKLGNWALYGGYVEQWYGPGHDGALLFSNSARPFPKIGFKRLSPGPINLPVLRWLGPIRFEAFGGVLTEKRDFDNPAVIGMKLGFEPIRGLEIGLNRALQLCGANRPCKPKTIGKALIGFGNEDNTGTFNEPGNQIAGFDISFTRNIMGVTTQLYFEGEAEDEDNFIIEQYARLGGLALSGALGKNGASWSANFEYTDTLGSKLFGGRKYPGSLYNQFIYVDGFTYKRLPIGYSLDSDSRNFTVSGAVNDTANRRWYGSVRSAKINLTEVGPFYAGGPLRNRISSNTETVQIATAGVELPTQYGDIKIEGRLQNDAPNTPDSSKLHPAIEVGFRSRF